MDSNIRQKVLGIVVSPYKMEIVKNIAESGNTGLSTNALQLNMESKTPSIEDYLNTLVSGEIITGTNERGYTLTNIGKKVYKEIKQTINEM